MARCEAARQVAGSVRERCEAQALWDGYCEFHRKVAEGLITDAGPAGRNRPAGTPEYRKLSWSPPRKTQSEGDERSPLDRALEEWDLG